MYNSKDDELVIKEHDFQSAKNSLKRFSKQAKDHVKLSSVPTTGGLFGLGNHKVTGSELNEITSEIQGYLIKMNQLHQGFIDEFGQVYKAFDSLDKDYISGIVTSIKASEKINKEVQENRETIRKVVDVLKEHETLKHKVDKLWENSDGQSQVIGELSKRLESVNQTQIERFEQIKKEQEDILTHISETQAEDMRKLKAAQDKKLDQITKEQFDKLSEINQSIEAEKLALNDKVTSLLQRVKVAYAVAGGAIALSIVHLVFSFAGIL